LICVIIYFLPRAWLVRGLLALVAGVILLRYAVVFQNPGVTAPLVLLLPCRLDAFLAGGLVALLPAPRPGEEIRRQGMALAVLVGSIAAFIWFTQGRFGAVTHFVLPTYYLMLATGSAAVLELCAGSSPVVKWLMESAPMIRAGRLSYFLYLFHLPVLWTIYSGVFGVMPNLESGRALLIMAAVVVVLYGLAELSYHFIEGPLIRRSHGYFRLRAG
jgi:peptidoglycan/LPS O-acetylase OafA/YrhL